MVEVAFNRPTTMNAMGIDDIPELVKFFDGIAKDPEVRVVIITGTGKAFSAGADLSVAMKIFQGEASPTSPPMDVVAAMGRVLCPIIGAINGPAITGGFEVALACDILIASTAASFTDTHAAFGIHPCWGLSQKLQRLVGANHARHISLSAAPVTAEQAERWGLVSQVVPPEALLPAARTLAQQIGSNHPDMVKRYKALIADGGAMALGNAWEMERSRADGYYKAMTPEDFGKMQQFLMARSAGKKKSKL